MADIRQHFVTNVWAFIGPQPSPRFLLLRYLRLLTMAYTVTLTPLMVKFERRGSVPRIRTYLPSPSSLSRDTLGGAVQHLPRWCWEDW